MAESIIALAEPFFLKSLSIVGDKKPEHKTLADLERRQISVEPQILEPIEAEKVLATYEQAVELFSTQRERSLALRRMADLTMVATEDRMIDSLEEDPQVDTSAEMDAASLFKECNTMGKVFLFNTGLDVGYMAFGAYLLERGKRLTNIRYQGFGQSLMLQGAFLFAFDLVMYAAVNSHSKEIFDGLSLMPSTNGIGLALRF